ncbi:hypothetical protein [Haloferula sp. BvORR071]|uniref:hypothetical protein n=1 Tax=Haloferula sp. BvORR071 TaxID=1396141 RepID=UPI0005595035|nr:hypothetical protein [Haloferula sp. BvORR071]
MNFCIVTHLLKTDLRRLRWLLLVCWGLLLLASWPALSFSAAHFDMPISPRDLLHGGSGDSSITGLLEKQGFFSTGTIWAFITLDRVASYSALILAGCLGFHSRVWSEGRPVRRRESLLAKTCGLLFFLILPLALLATTVGLLQGVPWTQALAMGATRASVNLPALLGVMLFGAYCGRWWTWLAGMFGMFLICTTLPIVLRLSAGPDWFWSPLQEIPAYGLLYSLKPWIAVAVLTILLLWVRRDLPGSRKLGIALAAILAASQLALFFLPSSPYPGYYGFSNPLSQLPDWSRQLHPELDGKSLEASIDQGVKGRGSYSNSLHSFNGESYMNLLLPWKTGGLPAGSFINWKPVGSSALKVGDTVVSRTPGNRVAEFYQGDTDEAALNAMLKPEGGKLRWDSPSNLVDSRLLAEVLTPVGDGMVPEASLEMNLEGTVVQLEKIVDVPFGSPVTVKADGVELHIRRLDIGAYMPVADICYVAPGGQNAWDLAMRTNEWIPVIYFPKQAMARLPWSAQFSTMPLTPGLTAFRQLYHTGQTSSKGPDLKGYDEARFILVKRRYVATAKAEVRTPTLPFVLEANHYNDPEARDSSDPPAFDRRPDPATTTAAQFEQWMKVSYSDFDRDWGGRNIADYVPRYLDRILHRRSGVSPPSTPEGRAIELACPESRKREVIDALLATNRRNDANWIPDVLIRRGWVTEAKPEILQMLADGQMEQNLFAQLMVANLEDPQTYPALLGERQWFETYEKLRLLPGIEPLLTETVAKAYREVDEVYAGRPADERFYGYLTPAAHGMSEALDHLIQEWEKIEPIYRRTRADYLRQVIQLPGEPDDWRSVLGALTGRKAADFRYDPLARMWIPITAP